MSETYFECNPRFETARPTSSHTYHRRCWISCPGGALARLRGVCIAAAGAAHHARMPQHRICAVQKKSPGRVCPEKAMSSRGSGKGNIVKMLRERQHRRNVPEKAMLWSGLSWVANLAEDFACQLLIKKRRACCQPYTCRHAKSAKPRRLPPSLRRRNPRLPLHPRHPRLRLHK